MPQSLPEAVYPFLGYRYARSSPTNGFPIIRGCLPPSLRLRHGDERLIDCSSFVTASLAYMFPMVEWDEQAYEDMQIMDATRLWSPVDCWQRHGLGSLLDVNQRSPQWGVYQSWVDDQLPEFDGDGISGGHQWFYHGGMGVRVHSTSIGGRGPVYEYAAWPDLVKKYPAGVRGVALSL